MEKQLVVDGVQFDFYKGDKEDSKTAMIISSIPHSDRPKHPEIMVSMTEDDIDRFVDILDPGRVDKRKRNGKGRYIDKKRK